MHSLVFTLLLSFLFLMLTTLLQRESPFVVASVILSCFRLLTVVGKHRGEPSSPGPKAASAPGITPLTPRYLK